MSAVHDEKFEWRQMGWKELKFAQNQRFLVVVISDFTKV